MIINRPKLIFPSEELATYKRESQHFSRACVTRNPTCALQRALSPFPKPLLVVELTTSIKTSPFCSLQCNEACLPSENR